MTAQPQLSPPLNSKTTSPSWTTPHVTDPYPSLDRGTTYPGRPAQCHVGWGWWWGGPSPRRARKQLQLGPQRGAGSRVHPQCTVRCVSLHVNACYVAVSDETRTDTYIQITFDKRFTRWADVETKCCQRQKKVAVDVAFMERRHQRVNPYTRVQYNSLLTQHLSHATYLLVSRRKRWSTYCAVPCDATPVDMLV